MSASYNVLYKSTIIVLHVCIYRIKLASPTQFHSPVAGFPARREPRKASIILSTRICTKIAARFFSSTPLQIPSLKQSCIPCVLDSNIDTRTIYTTYNQEKTSPVEKLSTALKLRLPPRPACMNNISKAHKKIRTFSPKLCTSWARRTKAPAPPTSFSKLELF